MDRRGFLSGVAALGANVADQPNGNVRATGPNSQFQAYGLDAGINLNFGQYYDENGELQKPAPDIVQEGYLSTSAPDSAGAIRKTFSLSSHFTVTGPSNYKTVFRLNAAGHDPVTNLPGDDLVYYGFSHQGAAVWYDTSETNPPGYRKFDVCGRQEIRSDNSEALLTLNNLANGKARLDFKSNGVSKGHVGLAGGLLGYTGAQANDLVVVAQSGQDIVFVLNGGSKIVRLSDILAHIGL